jgi:hypothetical protein
MLYTLAHVFIMQVPEALARLWFHQLLDSVRHCLKKRVIHLEYAASQHFFWLVFGLRVWACADYAFWAFGL